MQISSVLLVLYLAYGHQVSAVDPPPTFIGGRTSCGAIRSVTASSFASSNCYRLTNANANLACSRNYNKPTVINTGTSLFSAACNDPTLLTQGPRFGMYDGNNLYYPDVQLVSSDSSAAILGLTTYLFYDPTTGYFLENNSPPYDMTQVYSFVLINKLTGASSDPVYFTAKLGGCSLVIAGPSSITICTGPVLPAVSGSPAPGTAVATYMVCSTVIANAIFDAPVGLFNCPLVTASTNGDFTPCYITTPNTVGANSMSNYVLGIGNLGTGIPLVKFSQTLTITATPVLPSNVGNYVPGTRSILVTYDPTCPTPTVTTTC